MDGQTIRYQHLGVRAFWLFFFRKSRYIFGIVALMVALILAKRYFVIPDELLVMVDQVIAVLLAVFFLVLVGAFLISILQYLAYEFVLDEHALKMRSGILNIEIEAIPYRQIQNVDVERDIIYRLFGISRIVILTAGEESAKDKHEDSEGVIPALDKHKALALQEELLKRANIEKVEAVPQSVQQPPIQ